MDSALIIAAAAALDPLLLIAGFVVGLLVGTWRNRLIIAVAILVAALFLLTPTSLANEPFASLGRGVALLFGISIGAWIRDRRTRSKSA